MSSVSAFVEKFRPEFQSPFRFTLFLLNLAIVAFLLVFLQKKVLNVAFLGDAWVLINTLAAPISAYWLTRLTWWHEHWKRIPGPFVIMAALVMMIVGFSTNDPMSHQVTPQLTAEQIEQIETDKRQRVAEIEQFIKNNKALAVSERLEEVRAMSFSKAENKKFLQKIIADAGKYLSTPGAIKQLKQAEAAQQRKDEASRKKALAEFVQTTRNIRSNYAAQLEKIFLDQGMDVYVTVEGKNKDVLRLKYVLCSRPLVYKLTTTSGFTENWRIMGFTKLICDTGFKERWEIPLVK